mmetsp:Transcript_107323/g.256304  ORF Transcript_107323/g.256304 Transcript_107323/m.256304 type:complete len:581 (-) Transcript_107323:144-1886(-)
MEVLPDPGQSDIGLKAKELNLKDPDEDANFAGGYHAQKTKDNSFVVRNTFIDQIPGTPSSPYMERQTHSCPNTKLLDHATPNERVTPLQAVPGSPGGSEASGLGTREKPWSPDLVASLVNAAAAAVEMHTPSLPGASRRSSPLMPKASRDDEDEQDTRCDIATPSPWQSSIRPEQFCATPSPWQGSAVVNPELTAKLLAMGKESSDGRVQDPVAMIVASAAAAANREPPPPPQAPAPVYCKTAASPLAPPLRLPRIESGIGIIDEGETSGLHSASSDPDVAAPDALAMAESFAALVKQNEGLDGSWWQPMEEQPVSAEGEERIRDFVNRWGLDHNCEGILRNLPQHVRHEVLTSFLASPETRNVSAKFMSWLSSRMRNFEEIQSALVTTPEERLAFYNKWRLDQKCRQLVEEQAPYVQRELISNFNPPAGTKNVAGRMTAFLNMILNKTRFRSTAPQSNSPSKRESTRGTPADKELAKRVDEFVAHWGLDSGARSALVALPQDVQQAAMDGFSPSTQTECPSRRFIAYLRSAKPYILSRNGKGKSGKGRPKAPTEGPVPAGLMILPQKVDLEMFPKLPVR